MNEIALTHKQILESLVLLANAVHEKRYLDAQEWTADIAMLLDHMSKL